MQANARQQRILWGTGTSRVLRVHWALLELDVPYQNNPVRTRTPDMDTDEFLAISPQKKIPVLQDGDLTLAETSAIVTYLAERYSNEQCQLIPTDIGQRALYFQWMSFASTELDATALYVLRRHADLHAIYGEAPTANKTAKEYFDRMIQSAVGRVPEDGYLLGEQFTGADILFTTCLNWAKTRYDLPIPARFERYLDLTTQRPAFDAAMRANTVSEKTA
jgi:glutathione S-transferase